MNTVLPEKDARTKWCPFVRFVALARDNEEGSANRWAGFENPSPCRCIASDCMAWRWGPKGLDKGYCGLAGTGALP